MVDVVVITYNQEKYISQAIESILEQKCDFDYHIIIGEDCSQDSTRQNCERFAELFPDKIILLRNESNYGLVKNYKNVFSHCNSKYIAILEGDDYWIDPLKLQKQVEILESNNSIGLVHTGSYTLFENGKMKKNHLSVSHTMLEGNIYESLLVKKNTISPMTVMFRKELLDIYVDFDYYIENNFKTIDYSLWLTISQYSEVAYIDEQTSVYRFLKKSVSRPESLKETEDFYQTALKSKQYHYKMNPVKGVTQNEVLSPVYLILAEAALSSGDINESRKYAGHIVTKGFRTNFLKLAIDHKLFYFLYRVRLRLLPFFSDIKQILNKVVNFKH